MAMHGRFRNVTMAGSWCYFIACVLVFVCVCVCWYRSTLIYQRYPLILMFACVAILRCMAVGLSLQPWVSILSTVSFKSILLSICLGFFFGFEVAFQISVVVASGSHSEESPRKRLHH
ncbi:hypothetical protein BO78DRAFT_107641 [Aspergillus sclerotiicarbonarius CBS 121057]|uniref:Uncharacterized protein n=1 Tax=Aspergillus sclerotiicarbonarius (strain CBS 121057 / IBT 28362) TaxID=1448318 RepID=A0A319ESR3_ASPSB|nr:hypothetical protein BO78DRAFT_107641 [Aspergillus sclerotiicarbonarius CBS 121057]